MKQFADISKIIHREGYIFIVIFAAATFLFASFSSTLGWIGFIATAWCVYFFRNPDRHTPTDEHLVVSPGDGVVTAISDAPPPAELGLGDEEMLRISVFLNVFDVHVNRIPVGGKVTALHYHPGKFFNASLDKASIHNERQSVLIETKDGVKVVCVQIAGLIARRIVCDLEEGEDVKTGERYGIIRFGSRMDVYLPRKTVPLVCVGQRAIGGETIFANFKSSKVAAPKFEVR
jgi:phosphatidylserine decarboxylase